MGGSLAPVRVAGFTWNGWQPSAVYAMSRVLEKAGINPPRSEAEVHMLIEALEDLESEGVLQDLSTSNKGWGITSGAKGDISLSVGFKVGF
jgi:hypothetical protein